MTVKTYSGSCHCGAVRFECDVDLASGTTRCNCSFCKKARFWMTLVSASNVRLLDGESVLTDYQHTPPSLPSPFLHLTFCSRCGVRPFSRGGEMPQFPGGFYAVNVACLDDVTDAELDQLPIRCADGKNDRWDVVPETHRYL